MNVLSLFDGMSCGRIALDRVGINTDKYYASEIDKHAIQVSQKNFPDIIHLGDVTKWEDWDIDFSKIDLLIAGSPCQGFSMAGKQLAFDDPRSALYFVFEDILNKIRSVNPRVKFLLENVRMKKEHKDVITSRLGVSPVAINSNLFSAQNRQRVYWTNIEFDLNMEDKGEYLHNILDQEVDEKYFIKAGRLKWLKEFGEVEDKAGYVAFNPLKAKCPTVRGDPSWNTTYILQWPRGTNKGGIRAINSKTPSLTTSSWPANNLLLNEGLVRKLTPEECEKLQTVPVGYTACVKDTHRYAMLGNGWTVDVIAHIFKGLKEK